ncbi:MAG: extracellular solute-binding protein [Spirochaetaceae bacterium]
MKKAFLMVSMIFFGIALFAAGNQEEEKTTGELSAKGVFPVISEPITVDMLIVKNPLVKDYNTNAFVNWFSETTNVNFTFDEMTHEDEEQKVNLLLAAQQYPEVMLTWGLNAAQLAEYGGNGSLLRLNELIEEHAPNLTKLFNDHPWLKAGVTLPDGGIYTLPWAEENYQTTMHWRMYVYSPWIEKWGGEPQTTEEFYQFLKWVKEEDPNGNGVADEVPLNSARGWGSSDVVTFLMNSFVYTDYETYLDPNNGKLDFAPISEEWKEGLKYIAKLYSEGLITPDAFTAPYGEQQAMGESDPAILAAGTAGWMNEIAVNYGDSGRYMEYNTMPPLAGPDGARYAVVETPFVRNMLAITDRSNNPIAIIKAFDMCYDPDVVKKLYYGVEGDHWRKADAGELGLNGKQGDFMVIKPKGAEVQNDMVYNLWPSFRSADFFNGIVTDNHDTNHEARLLRSAQSYAPYATKEALGPLFFTVEEIETMQDETENLLESVRNWSARFVTGTDDIDASWDEYVAELEGLGYKTYLKLNQESYNRARGK